MTGFLLLLAAAALAEGIHHAIRSRRRTLTDAEQWEKARRATTPDEWRPL
jgi:hypothetical protein